MTTCNARIAVTLRQTCANVVPIAAGLHTQPVGRLRHRLWSLTTVPIQQIASIDDRAIHDFSEVCEASRCAVIVTARRDPDFVTHHGILPPSTVKPSLELPEQEGLQLRRALQSTLLKHGPQRCAPPSDVLFSLPCPVRRRLAPFWQVRRLACFVLVGQDMPAESYMLQNGER